MTAKFRPIPTDLAELGTAPLLRAPLLPSRLSLAWASPLAMALAIAFAAPAHADETGAEAGADASAGPDAAPIDLSGDDSSAGGNAIIVTARRREETAQDVPVALSVVDAGTLERTGNFTLGQVQQLVPSLQVVNTNPRNSAINIRGLGANSSIAVDGLEYGVGFYLDGVYYGRPGQSQFDLVDLQQIEVLHGPQGTLFGKNTTSGAINATSQLPSFDPELTAEASLGDHGYHQVRASGSTALVADKVAVRLSLADTHRDGFLRNLYTGTRAQDYDNFTVRGQLLIKPVDDVQIRLIGDYSTQHQKAVLSTIDGYFTTYADGTLIANNILQRAARANYTLPTKDAFAREASLNSPYQANMKSYGVSGQVDWDFGPATLTSITAYRWWDWHPANDVDNTSLAIQTKAQTANFQRQFSQELRVASNGTNKIDYVAGVYYFWQIVRGYSASAYGKDWATWNVNPATATPARIALADYALNGFEADSYSNPSTKSYAAFGQLDWHATDTLTLTGGLRYTHEKKEGGFSQWWVAGNSLSSLSDADQAIAAAYRNALNREIAYTLTTISDNSLGGLVTLSYKPTQDTLLYGTYSHGSKSGGLNVTAGGVGREVVKPEKVDAYEIGFKSQWLDRRLTVNGAAFWTDVTDYQANITEPIAGTTSSIQYISNIPKVRSKGVEGDVSFAANEWLSFSASGSYTDAKYVTYTNAPNAPERLNEGASQDLSGVRLPGVSKFAYSLAVDASLPLDGEGGKAYVHADYLHRSSFNSSATNSIYSEIPGYGVLNARLGFQTSDERFDFSIWARNLTGEKYYVTRSGSNFGLISAIVGDPRTVGATVRVKL